MAVPHTTSSEPMPSDELPDTPVRSLEAPPRTRQYLSLQRLALNELPYHPDFPSLPNENKTSLAHFLSLVLAEVAKVDFDHGWTSQGKWHPEDGHVHMPVPPAEGFERPVADSTAGPEIGTRVTKPVAISVDQRVKVMDKATWLARSSFHPETHVKYSEFDELLSQEHSRNEARYTPSVYDANELLAWSPQDLGKAVDDLRHDYNTRRVQMSIFQMFHKMPELLGGLSLLNDRVFHVLVITVHSTPSSHVTSDSAQPREPSQSVTVQLPIDFESFKDVGSVKQKSHVQIKGSSRSYYLPSPNASTAVRPTEEQKERIGKKLTEGNYVSLERLCKASKELPPDGRVTLDAPPAESGYHHRWDMMTLSTAGGITRLAPKRVAHTETLKAIAADVHYVVKHIAEARQNKTR